MWVRLKKINLLQQPFWAGQSAEGELKYIPTMEKAPLDYSITIQVLNLGTKDEFELIEPKKVEKYEPIIEDITDQKEQMSDTNGAITDPQQIKLDDI